MGDRFLVPGNPQGLIFSQTGWKGAKKKIDGVGVEKKIYGVMGQSGAIWGDRFPCVLDAMGNLERLVHTAKLEPCPCP